jgi:hypothetical protein
MHKRNYGAMVTLGVLGGISALGCRWQYKRYKESKFRWDRILDIMASFKPIPLRSFDL